MTVYGTAAQVAAFARVWTIDGAFTTATNPTLDQVNTWLTQCSSQMDLALANHWFIVPVDGSLEEALNAINMMVVPLVADLCHAANSSGRFFTDRAIERGASPIKEITKEINTWVESNADGLVALGLEQRSRDNAEGNQLYIQVI